MSRRPLAGLVAVLTFSAAAVAADPKVSVIVLRGVQRGTEKVLTFSGARLADAEEVFFYDPGFEVVKKEPGADGNSLTVTVKVAADCRLGEHMAQIRCKTGVSDFRTFWVGALPETTEQEPNNEFEKPQPITLGTTVTGVVDTEDVDYFTVEARKGQRINVEIEGLRLGTQIDSQFDPFVAILNQDRFELAVADDTPLVRQDGIASVLAPEDGRFVVLVRDSSYRGSANCHYRMHVGEFPRPLAVYPAGGPAGQETEVTFIGDPSGPFTQKLTPPTDPNADFVVIAEQNGQVAPSANAFRVSSFGNVLEVEPNNGVAEATPADLPNAMNGVLGAKGDVDFFRFKATKGQTLRVECYARRLRTPVDPVLVIHNAQGGGITSADDTAGPDAGLDFAVPEDGEYLVQVYDQLLRGGPEFVYRIEMTPPSAGLDLTIPRTNAFDFQQIRQQIVVPRGGRFGTLVNANRRNFGGKIVLEADRLPPGIAMIAEPMNENLASMPVLFEAAADAPLGGFLMDLKGYKDDNREIEGRFTNTTDLMRYQNLEMFWTATVDRLPIAVVERLPYSIEIVEPKVPLVRNGALNLKVVAKRDEGFKAPITVEFPFRPPGVGTLPAVTIPEGQTEVLYPINADGNAQPAAWKVYALASADVGGTGVFASPFSTLGVADNFINLAPERAAVVQGQPTEVYAKVEVKTPFEGTATAVLLGAPNKVTAEPVQITKDTTEVRFKVQTAADSPVGRHTGLIIQVTTPKDGEQMVHNAGGVELRIDAPPPMPTEQPAAPPAAEPMPMPTPPPAAEPAKPLSRLEQLRLEAKKKMEQGGMK